MKSDPIGLEDGINTYVYAYQNPITNIDPDGQNTIVIGGTTGGVVAGPPDAFVGGLIGAGILLGGYYLYSQQCEDKACPPCDPSMGTFRYRIDMVPPSKPHYAHTGSHVHLCKMNQNPKIVSVFGSQSAQLNYHLHLTRHPCRIC